jgi:coenzyme F420-reducing hydrogenase delta subunit
MDEGFEPKILAFCCQYCAYAAADLAGSMRLEYPPNVRIVRLPCSGRVDVLHILRSFEEGIDGVMVAGCEEGNCHFLQGNLRAKKRVLYAKTLLREVGLEDERLEMFNISAAQGKKFAQICQDMVSRIRKLGPNPLKR